MRFIKSNDMLLAGIVSGSLFWFFESAIHAYAFHDGSFAEQFLPTDPNEFWMRSLVVFLLVIFGIYAQRSVNRRRRAERALFASEEELRILSSQLLTAQEVERAKVSRELHENINQYLCSIKFRLEESLNTADSEPGDEKAQSWDKTVAMFHEVVENLRMISTDLRPSTLDALGIVATIHACTQEYQERNPSIRIDEQINIEERDVPESLKIILYRILQEALKNAEKHSEAGRITVALEKIGERVSFVIDDDGVGFDWEKAFSGDHSERGTGLGGMKKRAELSGGVFSCESSPARGTTIRASWPAVPSSTATSGLHESA